MQTMPLWWVAWLVSSTIEKAMFRGVLDGIGAGYVNTVGIVSGVTGLVAAYFYVTYIKVIAGGIAGQYTKASGVAVDTCEQ
jgi:uncharacterized membrane-anchored protein